VARRTATTAQGTRLRQFRVPPELDDFAEADRKGLGLSSLSEYMRWLIVSRREAQQRPATKGRRHGKMEV
jgi:hypothetical protein